MDDKTFVDMDECRNMDDVRTQHWVSAPSLQTSLFASRSQVCRPPENVNVFRCRWGELGHANRGQAFDAMVLQEGQEPILGEHDVRAAEDVARELHRERARDRQRECRRRRRKAANGVGNGSLSAANTASEDGVNRRLVRRDVQGILGFVESTLGRQRRSRRHKQAVMRTVWESPLIREHLPREAQKVPAADHAREGIVSSLCQSLSEVKTSRTRAQLVTKHAILTAAITNGALGSARRMARLLGVHHRNVTMAASRRATMLSNVHIQWTLSVRQTRSDATSADVKDIVGNWWATQTRPSPNRKEVVRKWVAPKTYDQHHAQYLLESLVSTPFPFNFG